MKVFERASLLSLMVLVAACGGGAVDDQATEPVTDIPADTEPAPVAAQAGVAFDTAAARGERPLFREVYSYGGTSRDPFRALIAGSVGGPELPDMILSTVLFNEEDPGKSIAIFRELGNTDRHTVRTGDRIGNRLYVASISPGTVTLTMNDFGTVRRQTYKLRRQGNQR